ncbi:YceI family protein [Xanthomonas sp. 1678]|uniref:YceI family protein n=1 Tax=Xanthomonas sp. 1678 TaxID=3158788 RepID=UPI00285C00CD|nr:polyisoprenoid-binding protein YceI [Xanthomonas translucens]
MLQRCLTALLLICPTAALAAPAQYALDPVHTRVLFAIEHAGFSKALGTVSGSTGTLLFDPDDWRSARLDARVPLQRLDLGDEKWNRAALARNLVDGERYPEAHFVSTRIEPIDATHAKVFGTLTLHGVSREIALEVTLNALKRHPLPPFRRTVGFSATATLQRADFGIDAWPSVIGAAVELRIEAEATRNGGADAEPAPATTPATDPDTPPSANQDATP